MTAPSDDSSALRPTTTRRSPTCARTRDYYQALGYDTPYRWAHYVDAPFQPLKKPLAAVAASR